MLISRMLLARMFLTGAILTEVAGTSSMTLIADNGAGWLSYLPMWVLIALSYLMLAKAAKTISIGIAFALWEGLGIALITLVSVLFLDYSISPQALLGLAPKIAHRVDADGREADVSLTGEPAVVDAWRAAVSPL